MVRTSDFPQADRLSQVGKVVIAISQGHQADGEIESYLGLDSRARQGRYYRLAAKNFGLVSYHQNTAFLTELGEEFASLTTEKSRKDFLARCLVEAPVFQEALRYINLHTPTTKQLQHWFYAFYPSAKSTAKRRFHSFESYLYDAGLLEVIAGKNHLRKYAGSVVKKTTRPMQGLQGRPHTKNPLASLKTSAEGKISFDVDAQKRERANQIHWQLVDAKASFLFERNIAPFSNEHIDLYGSSRDELVFYEMKSISLDGENLIAQIRKAVSQLYEYRFIYNEPKARLCIITNHGISQKNEWLLEYLQKDRAIAYGWSEDLKSFNVKQDSRSLLGSFSP